MNRIKKAWLDLVRDPDALLVWPILGMVLGLVVGLILVASTYFFGWPPPHPWIR